MNASKYLVIDRGSHYDVYRIDSSVRKEGRGGAKRLAVVFAGGSTIVIKRGVAKLLSDHSRDLLCRKLTRKPSVRTKREIPYYVPTERDKIDPRVFGE